jgi:hypothetical protein
MVGIKNMIKPKYVDTDDVVCMPELDRPYYNSHSYNHLKAIIQKDSFKSQYAIRVIWDNKLRKWVTFDGNHRLLIAKELEIKRIPILDETNLITRSKAIAEGIKANTSHAYYNAIDLAKNAKQLLKSLTTKPNHKSVGRPVTGIVDVAEMLGMSERRLRNYLNLLELPEDVQVLVGKGFGMSNALVLFKLLNTPHSSMISEIAHDANSKGTSSARAIKQQGHSKNFRLQLQA